MPAAPGNERADRLHLPHVRCTALPARCLRACMVHSAICHTTHVRTGFGREHRQRAFTLDEQRLHVRAVMTCLEAHHDVAIRSGLVAVHSVDRRAVNICNILLQTARLRVLTCCASCAVLDHGCLQQGAPGQRRQVASAQIGCTCRTSVAPHCRRSVHMQSGVERDACDHAFADRFRVCTTDDTRLPWSDSAYMCALR